MLFVEAGGSIQEFEEIPKIIPGDHVFNMSASGKVPVVAADEVGRLGYKLMILPNFATLATIKAVKQVYEGIAKDGSIRNVQYLCARFSEFTDLGDLDAFEAVEERFSV
ncbi:carboxyvinyl-carboxyphosphonate phosphorylmutase [Caballeronia calidae]|uniref:Carboxyvinyl-carboxyphosphonate phosphorylmutase n=2 Tax=Caballeronia calidae TaxID=1777139 RepID=A0A158DUP0_9BURK|nr:carboxyvinyl-carboxyphosphonate phosphorylmutase [Caballeronia calidae]